MKEYIDAIKKYAVFSGRATRREFWMFSLYNAIISILLSLFSMLLFVLTKHSFTGINSIYKLFVLVPNIAIGARRLHDTNHNGKWIFLIFIPIIGWIWLFVLLISPTQLSDSINYEDSNLPKLSNANTAPAKLNWKKGFVNGMLVVVCILLSLAFAFTTLFFSGQ